MPVVHWADVWSAALPHLIRAVVGLVLLYVLWRLVRRAVPPTLDLLLRRELKNLSAEELRRRSETLELALRRIIATVIAIGATFVVLSEVGLNIVPLIAGFGIAGIAVGFAAQYMIRDVLNGLVLLVENWYSKGDVVRVAGVSGVVEDITLRRTVIRDQDGIVHSVPNGEISTASNFTKHWSQINMNVTVSYQENLDEVIALINQVGRELADDQYWSTAVLEPPHVLRVDSLAPSGVEIKIVGNTRPIRQWDVMGELRLRLKARFDQEGVEIPLPHSKVYFGNALEQLTKLDRSPPRHETGLHEAKLWRQLETPHALQEPAQLSPVIWRNRWGLVSDVDGTLSPIAAHPEEAVVPAETKAVLAALRGRIALIAIVSGRNAQQTRELVGLAGVTYVGLHGLERMEGEEQVLAPGAAEYLPLVEAALAEIEEALHVEGTQIERKGLAGTVHYRNAPDPDMARSAVLAAIAHSKSAEGLKITEGRRVIEIRPPLAINKGTVLRALVREHRLEGVLYLGDDISDMDAFYEIHRLQEQHFPGVGIGVFNAEAKPEFRAVVDLMVHSTDEVRELLTWLADARSPAYLGRVR